MSMAAAAGGTNSVCFNGRMDFPAYLLAETGAPSLRAVALRSGLEPSTLSRQLRSELKVSTVTAICRAYGLPILPAFTAAGFITEAEAAGLGSGSLRDVPGSALAAELLRREQARERQTRLP